MGHPFESIEDRGQSIFLQIRRLTNVAVWPILLPMKTKRLLPISKQEIAELLSLLNWSPEKLAFEMMVGPRTVARWLSGENTPPPSKRARLRQLLDAARKAETSPSQRPIRNPLDAVKPLTDTASGPSTPSRRIATHREE